MINCEIKMIVLIAMKKKNNNKRNSQGCLDKLKLLVFNQIPTYLVGEITYSYADLKKNMGFLIKFKYINLGNWDFIVFFGVVLNSSTFLLVST